MKLFGPANATLSTLETEYRQQSDVNISVYIVLKVILTQNHFTFHFTLELWKLIMFCSPNAVNVILIYCKIFCVCVFFWADFSLSGYWGYTVWLFQLPDIDNSPVISHNISTFHTNCKLWLHFWLQNGKISEQGISFFSLTNEFFPEIYINFCLLFCDMSYLMLNWLFNLAISSFCLKLKRKITRSASLEIKL